MPGQAQCKKKRPYESALVLKLLFLLTVISLYFILLPLNAQSASDIRIGTEFNYRNSNIETTNNDTGSVVGSDFTAFDQNYNLSLSRQFYPFLNFNAGSSFEFNDSRSASDDLTTRRKVKNISPQLDVELRTPLYSAGIAYNKNQVRTELTDIRVSKDFQESMNLSFIYRPAGLPLFRLFHSQTHSYDDPRTSDTVSTQTTAKVSYNIKDNPVSYTYGRGEVKDKLVDLTLIRESHVGNASYSHSFLSNRLFMDASYRMQYNITSVPGAGGSIDSPLSPFRGIFSPDDSNPLIGGLTVLMNLIDPDVPAGGINIGWDSFERPAVGLDFGFTQSVDRLLIYVGDVDRNALLSVSDLFEWHIYTSSKTTDNIDDINTEWTFYRTVLAPLDSFQNRFELSFPEVTTRYIKVVITPLPQTPETIGDPDLGSISVTQVEASITDAVSGDQRITSSRHNISLNLAGRLGSKTRIGYNLQYSQRDTDSPSIQRFSLSNSIYANHIFNRIFTGSARVARDQSKTTTVNDTDESVGYDYSANLRAAYLETFSQTLTFGYRDIEEDQGTQSSGSVFLRTSAALYKGWDAFVDMGYSWANPSDTGGTTSKLITAQTSVIPNKKISFDATYTLVTSRIDDEAITNTRKGYDLRASLFPYRTLSLSSQISVEEQSQKDEKQVLQRYAASWSPLRGGDLQIIFSYSESQRPADNQEERNLGPVVKWDINRYASLTAAYFFTTVKTVLETTELSTMTAKLTMSF